jgi:photosystem II stability/assembly factor-like uncharacterized protein
MVGSLALSIALAPFAVPYAAAEPGCAGVTSDGEWTTIQGPGFPGGPEASQGLSAYAVHPRQPANLLATNGKTVMASKDSGCTWDERFSIELLPSLDKPISSATSTIKSISIPEDPAGANEIYLLIEERIGPAARPHVLFSGDRGATWELRDQGLPLATTGVVRMRVAPSDHSALYLLLAIPGSGRELYATTNGGNSWERRGQAGISGDFGIDPQNPQELWLWQGPLLHSTDGGRSTAHINFVPSFITIGDVFRAPGDPVRVMAFDPEGGAFWRTDDNGDTWSPVGAPSNDAISIAHGDNADSMILSLHKGVFRYQAPGNWIEITPGSGQGRTPDPDAEDLLDLSVDRTDAPSAYGRTSSTIEKYSAFSIDLPPLLPSAPPDTDGAGLTPPRQKVKLGPGESRRVPYRLTLPPQPTPLDVFFLVDTTDSMDSSIRGLLNGIHRISQDLAASKIDVQFGVGEYKDYPIPGYGDPIAGDFPYRLNRAIGPADGSLVAALERMQASGGGKVIKESQLTALYQGATGEGEPGFVLPGQDAGFRPGSLKVMINVTDAGFEDSAQHPSPPFDAVAQELADRNILQVGLSAFGPNGAGARLDLERMATATGTLVPSGGVDCDGDGFKELAPGAPLVCDVHDEESDGVLALAPAIVATLEAITDEAPVQLQATEGADLIGKIAPGLHPAVDVKDTNALEFLVTFTCPKGPALSSGKKAVASPVELVATVRGIGVASAVAEITCIPEPKVKAAPNPKEEEAPPPFLAPPPAPVAAIAVAPVPPPPPAPVTQLQPQPNPHVQGAAAHQEQEQLQVAVASTTHEIEEQYAFTAYSGRGRAPDPATALYLAAAGMAMGAAALRLRTRTQARTRVRRQGYR